MQPPSRFKRASREAAVPRSKDIWDKLPPLSALIASVLVPIALAVIGNSYATAMKEAENRVKYTELAIGILKEKPSPDTQGVREWAINVASQYSGVAMDSSARQQLLASRLAVASDFASSNLSRSRFDNAMLDESSFRDASMRNSDLRGADLSGSLIDEKTKLPK